EISRDKSNRYKATLENPQDKKRIIGGQPADIKQHPYVAFMIVYFSSHWEFKGDAGIIGEYWAITAAHCFDFMG
ncbi:hypothetical protein ILUMI_04361, partial [Ignelater luminosus]